MKINKFLLLLCLMVMVLSLSIVAAEDNNTQSHSDDKVLDNNNVNDNEAVIDVDKKVETKNSTDNPNVSTISKKTSRNVKEDSYEYDEDEEYGFNQGSYVELSYKKIKTNQYNITAKIRNSYDNPVKKGVITVYFVTNSGNYPTKTLSFKNGAVSFVQKFHTTGKVKIYTSDRHKVLYQSESSDISNTDDYRNTVNVKSDILSVNVKTASLYTNVPTKSDIDEKIIVETYTYDDGESSNKGTVQIYVDNKLSASKKVSKGGANFRLSIKKTGKHIIETDYKTDYGETFYCTDVIEITRKKENIALTLPKWGDTCEEIVIQTKVTNDTDKINRGYVLLKKNGKQFAKLKVKNGETTNIYRLPKYSDTYKITAAYINNNKVLASVVKEIKVYDEETLTYNPIKSSTTQSKIYFKATVSNPHVTVNYGTVKVYLNKTLLLKKAVKKGKISQNIIIPNKSGKYTLRVQYIKQNYIIIEDENTVMITDSEKLSYTFPKQLLPDNKYTFKVKVTSPNAVVNSGKVTYQLGSKKVTSNVKKGIATITIKTNNKEQNITATVTYLKHNKVVAQKTSNVQVYYTYKAYVSPPSDIIKGSKTTIKTYVYDRNYKDANSGKVVFYINNKKIGTANVKKGEATINYQVNNEPGYYTVSSVYYDKNNRKVAAEDYDYMTVVNQLTTDKNLNVKTLTPTYEYNENNQVSIGSSEYLDAYYVYSGSTYTTHISLTNSYWYYPKYNTLVSARLYFYSNGKAFTKTYGESDLFGPYRFSIDYPYAPYKVEVAYRPMNAQEKNYMKEYFGIEY